MMNYKDMFRVEKCLMLDLDSCSHDASFSALQQRSSLKYLRFNKMFPHSHYKRSILRSSQSQLFLILLLMHMKYSTTDTFLLINLESGRFLSFTIYSSFSAAL